MGSYRLDSVSTASCPFPAEFVQTDMYETAVGAVAKMMNMESLEMMVCSRKDLGMRSA